jgi:hypothetical protein
MSKKNHVCKVCGVKYSFCPNCAGVKAAEKYKTIFCSKNCRDIFHALSKYTVGVVNKDEAKDILCSLDLSNLSNFSEQIRSDVDKIMYSNKKHIKKKVIEEPVVDDITVSLVEETIVHDVEHVIEPTMPVEFEVVI